MKRDPESQRAGGEDEDEDEEYEDDGTLEDDVSWRTAAARTAMKSHTTMLALIMPVTLQRSKLHTRFVTTSSWRKAPQRPQSRPYQHCAKVGNSMRC